MRGKSLACAAGTVLAGLATPAAAQQVRAGADATVSAGVSSNPFLADGSGGGVTGYLEGVVTPGVTISDERGSSSVGGYLRGTAYLNNGYDPTWAIGLNGQSQRAVSERLTLRGSVQVDSSIIGERFNPNLIASPTFPPATDEGGGAQPGATPTPTPVPTDPVVAPPPQFIGRDITLLGARRRQTSFGGSAGLSYRLSARDSIYGDVQAQRSVSKGQFFSFSSYGGTVGYSHAISELTSVGARMSGQWTDYDDGGSGEVYQPQVTLDTQLAPTWNLSAGVGLLFSKTRTLLDRDSSTGLSGNVRTCRRGEFSQLCFYANRSAGPSGVGVISKQLTAGASYSLTLSKDDSVRASIDYSRVDTPRNTPATNLLARDDYSFFNASAAYDRRLSRRLRAGVAASYRDSGGGVSRGSDLSASVFLSTRLGSLR